MHVQKNHSFQHCLFVFFIINMNIIYYVIFGLMQHSLDNNMAFY